MLLNETGKTLKLADFGQSSSIKELHQKEKQCQGTFLYMSPEMIKLIDKSNQNNDSLIYEKCDVYSWGITFWHCFTRNTPFDTCENKSQLIHKKQKILKIPDEIPQEFKQILSLCILVNPNHRSDISTITNEVDRLREDKPDPDKIVHKQSQSK